MSSLNPNRSLSLRKPEPEAYGGPADKTEEGLASALAAMVRRCSVWFFP